MALRSALPPPPPGIRSMVTEDSNEDSIHSLSRSYHVLSAQKFARMEIESRPSLRTIGAANETFADGLVEPFTTTLQRIRQVDQQNQLIDESSELPRPFRDSTLQKQLAELDELVQPFRGGKRGSHYQQLSAHNGFGSTEHVGPVSLRILPDTPILGASAVDRSHSTQRRTGVTTPGTRARTAGVPSRLPLEDMQGARLRALLDAEEESMRVLRATLSSLTGAAVPGSHGRSSEGLRDDGEESWSGTDYVERSPAQAVNAMPPLPASPSTSGWGAATNRTLAPAWGGTVTAALGSGTTLPNGLHSVLQPGTESSVPAAVTPSAPTTLVVSGPESTVNRLYHVLQPVAGDAQALTRALLAGQEFLLLVPPVMNGAGHGTRELQRPQSSYVPSSDGVFARRRVRLMVRPDLRTLTWASAGQVIEGRLDITRLTSIRVPGHEEQSEYLAAGLRDAVQPETLMILTCASRLGQGQGLGGDGDDMVVRLVGSDPYTTATWVAGLTFLHDILPCSPPS